MDCCLLSANTFETKNEQVWLDYLDKIRGFLQVYEKEVADSLAKSREKINKQIKKVETEAKE